MRMRMIEHPGPRLALHPDPDNCWMRCDECSRFFQYKSALPVGDRPRDACPFHDCTGIGVGFNLFLWDDMREPEDPRWPKSEAELHHGMKSPEMESFYREQLQARIARLVDRFWASPEAAPLHAGGPARYLEPFFLMQSYYECDLTDGEQPYDDVLDVTRIEQLPLWSGTADTSEAPRMVAELQAFFEFARRTNAVPRPELFCDVLADPELEPCLLWWIEAEQRRAARARWARRRRKPKRKTRRRR